MPKFLFLFFEQIQFNKKDENIKENRITKRQPKKLISRQPSRNQEAQEVLSSESLLAVSQNAEKDNGDDQLDMFEDSTHQKQKNMDTIEHSFLKSPQQKLENSLQYSDQKAMMQIQSPASCTEEDKKFDIDHRTPFNPKQYFLSNSGKKRMEKKISNKEPKRITGFSHQSEGYSLPNYEYDQPGNKRSKTSYNNDDKIKVNIQEQNSNSDSSNLMKFESDSQFYYSLDESGAEQKTTKKQRDGQLHKKSSLSSHGKASQLSNQYIINLSDSDKNFTGENLLGFGVDSHQISRTFLPQKGGSVIFDDGYHELREKSPFDDQNTPSQNKKTKTMNLAELKTINEMYSVQQTEDRSLEDSFTTKHSLTEQRKRVSDYLLSEREPLFQNAWSKSYIGSKNQSLVLLKTMERNKIDNHTQEQMRVEFKQLLLREAEFKTSEGNQGQGYLFQASVPILDYFQTKAYIYIVYEYLHQQSLLSHLQKQPTRRMPDAKAVALIQRIVESLDQLAREGTQQHGNLKLENVFWDQSSQIVRLSDFGKSYASAKLCILSAAQSKNAKQFSSEKQQPNSDVRQIGIIYLQLLCGQEGISHTKDFVTLQKYVNNQNLPKQVVEFVLKCLFIDGTTLTDIRMYISKYQHRFQKSNPLIPLTQTPEIDNSAKGLMVTSALKSISRSPLSHPQQIEKGFEGRQSMQEIASDHKLGKVKETTFLKKYSYTQSNDAFELRITHQKLTKYYIKEELITNQHEFETTHSIPIFRNFAEEGAMTKKRTTFNQMNYNSKYSFTLISELDNQSYFEANESMGEEEGSHLINGYYRMFTYRSSVMRCYDKISSKNYVVKCINIEDDEEFLETLREIAIHKYIDHNIQIGLLIDQEKDEFGQSDNYQSKNIDSMGISSSNSKSLQNPQQSAYNLAENYLKKLYQQADKEVSKQFQGGIHKFVDSYIIYRSGQEPSFVLVFEDAEFSLKDFLLRNEADNSDHPHKEEIEHEQVSSLIQIMTKQIKKLKRIGLFHNSITPENIIFQTCKSGCKRILLSNFEYALILKPDQSKSEYPAVFQKLPSSYYKYKAPEIRKSMQVCLQDKETVMIDPIKSDIYSLGLCALELQLQEFLTDDEIMKCIQNLNNDTVDNNLLIYMVHPNPSVRFSEKEVITFIKEEAKKKQKMQLMLITPFQESKQSQNFTQEMELSKIKTIKENRNNQFQLFSSAHLTPREKFEAKTLNQKGLDYQAYKKDLFTFQEKSLEVFGEIAGDLQLLYQGQCARKLFLFSSVQNTLESLEQKYIKGKQKLHEQIRLEFLLLDELGNFRRDIYDRDKSLFYYQHSLSAQQKLLPDEILMSGQIQLKIAMLLLFEDQKNNNQMIVYLRNSLDAFKETLGNSSPKLVRVLTLLADEFASKGQVIDALHLYQECMIITNVLGYQGPLGIRLLDKLGWAFFQTSDYQSALKFFQRSAQVKEKVFIEKDISLAETYNNLAECNRVLNDNSKAIYYYEQALCVAFEMEQDKSFQSDSISEFRAQVFNNLGIMYKWMGKYEKAIKLFKESLDIRKEVSGSSSQEVMESQYNLAIIYDDQNRHTEAMELYDLVIQQFKLSRDLDNPMYAECLQNKGISYYQMNDYTRALTCLSEALAFKRKKTSNSVTLAITLQNIALVYHKQGLYKKSLQLYDEAIKIFVKKLKPDHPYITTIEENIKQTQRFAK